MFLCDICEDENPTWKYEVEDFECEYLDKNSNANIKIEYYGDWYSCSECSDLIDNYQKPLLAEKICSQVNNSTRLKEALDLIEDFYLYLKIDVADKQSLVY